MARAVGSYDWSALVVEPLDRGAAFAWVAEAGGLVRGVAMGDAGGGAMAVGAVIAQDRATGEALVRAQLANVVPGAAVRLDPPLDAQDLGLRLGLPPKPAPFRLAFMASRPVAGLPHARLGMVFGALSAIAG